MAKSFIVSKFVLLALILISISKSNGNRVDTVYRFSRQTDSEKVHEDEYNNNNIISGPEIEKPSFIFIIIYIVAAFYLFLAVIITCQGFFVPSLLVIGETFGIQDHVIGAGLMAIGLCIPQLFSTVLGIFVSHDDTNILEIAGASFFNVLLVLGVCGIFAKTQPDFVLAGWPLFRDVGFYLGGMIGMMFFFSDSLIMWWEAVLLILIYVLYCVTLKFGNKGNHADKNIHPGNGKDDDTTPRPGNDVENDDIELPEHTSLETDKNLQAAASENSMPESEVKTILTWPQGTRFGVLLPKIYFVVTYPIRVLLHISLPNVKVITGKTVLVWGYVGSMFWIAFFTSIFYWCLSRAISGGLLFSFGSIPNLIACVVAAREGHGKMAVSCCIAVNTFLFIFVLPLSWLVYTLFNDQPVLVGANGMICSVAMIFAMLVVLVGTILVFRWKMNKCFGVTFLVWYALLLLITVALEYKVLTCPKFKEEI